MDVISWYLYREIQTMNLEKIYTSPYRSFNFQQLFFTKLMIGKVIINVSK